MGFPIGYTEFLLPKLLLFTLLALGTIRILILVLFRHLGFIDFLEPHITWTDQPDCGPDPEPRSVSAELIRDILPVVKFSELVDPPESCAVCLYKFDAGDDIRRLINCSHVFHRSCLDRWMDHSRRTCPLCRTQFVPGGFDDRVRVATGFSDYYGEHSPFTTGF